MSEAAGTRRIRRVGAGHGLLLLFCLLATEAGAQGIGWPDTVGYRHLWAIRNLHGMRQDALELGIHPENWRASPLGMNLQGRVDLAVGVLRRNDERTALVSVGPVIQWQEPLGLGPAFLELGISPTFLEDTEFEDNGGDTELGSNFQFTSHIAVGFAFGPRRNVEIGYRIQHTSNANVDADNTGVDFSGVTARWRFR